jgi:hypothetical protein
VSAGALTDAPGGAPAGRLGVLVFAALVLASFAAFFLAQRLKHIPTAVQELKFDAAFYPQGGGAPASEPISFEIERADLVTVRIINVKGATVATLASEHSLGPYSLYTLHWSGRRGSPAHLGALAPRGEYRVLILLAHRKVELRSPSSVELVRAGA